MLPAALLAAVMCGCADSRNATSTTGPSPSGSSSFSGTLSDPAGDVVATATVPNPPDLVTATIDVVNQTLTVNVTFAPGTLAPQTGFRVYLDTDENAATGNPIFAGEGNNAIGADFGVTGLNPHDPSRAALQRNLTGAGPSFLGTLDVVMEANVRRLSIPLAQLGGDDGRLQFKVDCYQVIASSGTTQTIAQGDVIPNFGLPAGIVR